MALIVSVITAPKPDISSIVQDVLIVKHALLFADRVNLYSPSLALLHAARSQSHSIDDLLATFRVGQELQPGLDLDQLERKIRRAFDRPAVQRNPEQKRLVARIERYQMKIRDQFEVMLNASGYRDIQPMVEEGVVKLDDFGTAIAQDIGVSTVIGSTLGHESNDRFFDRYKKSVEDVVTRDRTYPLADEQVSDLVQTAIREGEFAIGSGKTNKAKISTLSWRILQNLPIGQVDGETIMRTRDEISDYTGAFRGAMAEFASRIETLPWDSDFEHEADRTFDTLVEPELTKIRKALAGSGFLRNLRTAMADEVTTKRWATGTLGLLSGIGLVVADVPGLVIAALASTGTAASVASSTWKKVQENRQDAERNDFYLYYKAEQNIMRG